jgi:hypothetical protein
MESSSRSPPRQQTLFQLLEQKTRTVVVAKDSSKVNNNNTVEEKLTVVSQPSSSIAEPSSMSQRLRSHKHTSRIEISPNGSPLYVIPPSKKTARKERRIRCVGLHRTMKEIFFPHKERRTVSKKSGSSKAIGIMVHRQMRHEAHCSRVGKCACGLKLRLKEDGKSWKGYKQSPFTRAILSFLESEGIDLEVSEVPLCYPDGKLVTWIDLLGHRKGSLGTSVKISLKTGHTRSFASDSEGLCFKHLQEEKIKCNTFNIHHLQSLCEDIMMELEYNERPAESFTLYAFKTKLEEGGKEVFLQQGDRSKDEDEEGEGNGYKYSCKKSEYPPWCKDHAIRRKISENLGWRFGGVCISEQKTKTS